eukprot:gene3504-6130_t
MFDVSSFSDDGLEGVVKSIFTPGVNRGVVQLLIVIFLALFVNNVCLLIFFGPNPHIIALLVLTIGLAAAMTWFIKELQKVTKENEEKMQSQSTKKKLK